MLQEDRSPALAVDRKNPFLSTRTAPTIDHQNLSFPVVSWGSLSPTNLQVRNGAFSTLLGAGTGAQAPVQLASAIALQVTAATGRSGPRRGSASEPTRGWRKRRPIDILGIVVALSFATDLIRPSHKLHSSVGGRRFHGHVLSDETAELGVTGPEGPVTFPAPERPAISDVGEISDSPLRPNLPN